MEELTNRNFDLLTPKQIVEELDKYIIGQDDAKKAVAIAIRNRIRRQRLSDEWEKGSNSKEYSPHWTNRSWKDRNSKETCATFRIAISES